MNVSMRRNPLGFVLLFLMISLEAHGEEKAKTGQEKAKTIDKLLQKGDEIFAKRYTNKKTWQAIYYYREGLKLAPNNFELLWRLGRVYHWLADNTEDPEEDQKYGEQGYQYAKKAAELKPDRVEGHFWAAVCIGEYSKGIGLLSALRKGLRGKFLNPLQKAYRINRRYIGSGPDQVYAMYYHQLPWPGRDNDKALEHLRKAQKIDPQNPRMWFYFATVLHAMDRNNEAKKYLDKCLNMNPKTGDAPERYRILSFCKKLAKKI